MEVAGLGLVGVAGVEHAPALAESEVGLDGHPVEVVAGERPFRSFGAAEVAEGEGALVVALLGSGSITSSRSGRPLECFCRDASG